MSSQNPKPPVAPENVPTRAEQAVARMDEALAALRLQRERIRSAQCTARQKRQAKQELA